MKKTSKKLLKAILFTGLTTMATASTETATINPDWFIYNDGHLFFYLAGSHSGSPCSITERWAIDTTTTAGKAQYSAFLMAYTTGKKVKLVGTSNAAECVHGNTEPVNEFHVVE